MRENENEGVHEAFLRLEWLAQRTWTGFVPLSWSRTRLKSKGIIRGCNGEMHYEAATNNLFMC